MPSTGLVSAAVTSGISPAANGYQLTVGDEYHTVPVSRSYVPKLRSFVG